jgi:hypothetical protein
LGIGINFIGRKIGEEIKKFVQPIFEARKDDNRRSILYNSAGEDSVPLDNERLILLKVDGTGKYVAVGVLTLSQGANPGEKIFFSRDNKKLGESSIVGKIKMLNNGDIVIDNDTETTDEAIGDFIQKIKNDQIKEIGGDENRYIEGNRTTNINGGEELSVLENVKWNIGGTLDIRVGGSIKINGSVIKLNS